MIDGFDDTTTSDLIYEIASEVVDEHGPPATNSNDQKNPLSQPSHKQEPLSSTPPRPSHPYHTRSTGSAGHVASTNGTVDLTTPTRSVDQERGRPAALSTELRICPSCEEYTRGFVVITCCNEQ